MKIKLCLCALLLSQSVPAALIDFNNIPVGTEVSSLNPYGAAVISTRFWLNEGTTTFGESFTRGVIGAGPDGSSSVVMEAGPLDAPEVNGIRPRWNIEIGVSFQTPISTFSVDVFSRTYTSRLIYTGFDDLGGTFTSSVVLGGLGPEMFDHFDLAAPLGGYITGFHFSQFEDVGSIALAMDNLDYTEVPRTIASVHVPETVGLTTFAFTIGAVLLGHRRMKAARR